MTETANYGLKKPGENDWADIAALNENMDAIDAALTEKLDADKKGAAGGVASLGSDGKVPTGQLPKLDYDPAGSAEAVRGALTAHVSNQNNPHGVTAQQAGADPAGSAASALASAKSYTDEQIQTVIGSINTTLDAINGEVV